MAERGKAYVDLLKYSGLGIEMGAAVVIGLLLGTWLDGRFGSSPWMTLGGLALGFAAAARSIVRAVRAEMRREAEEAERQPEGGGKSP